MGLYCMYLRKSRADAEAEAHGEGETLARHEKLLLEVAKRGNYAITEIYREIVSGESIAARPQMQQLLQAVEQGIYAGVLVVEVERLARGDTIDQGIVAQTFKNSNTKIKTSVKTYDPNNEFDEEYFEFGLFMSRREYKTINRRLQRGRIASAKDGKYVGNKPPYGYARVPIENDKGFTLKPISEEADIVRLIFHLYANATPQPDGSSHRMGTTRIARKLNAMHIPTRTGSPWTANNIRNILINPVYTGKIRWNFRPSVKHMQDGTITTSRPMAKEYILVDGLHPAIVEDKLFQQVQEIFHSNANAPSHYDKPIKNPLAGIVFCAKCEKAMIRRPYDVKNKTDTLLCKTIGCDNVSSELRLVEQRVLKGLADWLEDYKLRLGMQGNQKERSSQISMKQKAIQGLEANLQTQQKQLEKTYDLLEQEIYDTNTFLSRSQRITQRIDAIKSDLQNARQELHAEQSRQDSIVNIVPKVEHLLAVYDTLPDAVAKNDMLKSVIARAEYRKDHGTRWHGSPDSFEVVLFPRVPHDETDPN